VTKRPEPTSGTLWQEDINAWSLAHAIFIIGAIAVAVMLGWVGWAGYPAACDNVVGEIVTIRETGLDSYGNLPL
jgi:hypothetical protein